MNYKLYDWINLSILLILIILVSGVIIWAFQKSKIQNCCRDINTFKSCKSNFGSNFDMSSINNYKKICGF